MRSTNEYSVAAALASDATADATAVLVVHGMGQQIPFATLDQVAAGLGATRGEARAEKPGDELLTRLETELEFETKAGARRARRVHLYEAYWAPLTEGRITLGGVMRFLLGAAANGIRNSTRGHFRRWSFNETRHHAIRRTTLFLLGASAALILSLVVLNFAIAALVATAALPSMGLGASAAAAMLEPATQAVLSVNVDVVLWLTVLAAVLTGGSAAAVRLASNVPGSSGYAGRSAPLRRGVRRVADLLAYAGQGAAAIGMVVAAIAVLRALTAGAIDRADPSLGFYALLSEASAHTIERAAIVLVAVMLAFLVARALGRIVWVLLQTPVREATRQEVAASAFDDRTRVERTSVRVASLLLLAALGGLAWAAWSATAADAPASALFRRELPWFALAAVTWAVRNAIVQYVGDVAIYVMPYGVDAFDALRKEIRDRVLRTARSIYAMRMQDGQTPRYARVVVIGHSLGSVLCYDVLNRLILEDESSGGTLKISERTALLATFGSPLDKTAFIFSAQGAGTSEVRESLAAAVQPLLRDSATGPRAWVNVYTGADPVCGKLDLYSDPAPGGRQVDNVPDPEATTPLVAHTQYWASPIVWREVREYL